MTVQEVLDKWDKEGLVARQRGTLCHAFLENIKRGKVFPAQYDNSLDPEALEDVKTYCKNLYPALKRYHEDTKEYVVPLQEEFTVGIEEHIAGNIDLLVYNKQTEQVEIWDYKFIKELEERSKYNKTGKQELSAYPDCNYIHYSFQLNLYKEMLERKTGLKLGTCRLVYFNTKTFQYNIKECKDLQKEAKEALDRILKEDLEN